MRSILLAACALLVSGCAPPSGPAGFGPRADPREVIEASVEQVWPLLAEVYASLDLEVTSAEAGALRVSSTRARNVWRPWIGPREAPHARCVVPRLNRAAAALAGAGSSIENAPVSVPFGRVMVTVDSQLEAEGPRTRVQTRVILSPVSMATTPRPEEPYCVSTGRIEAAVAEALRERIAVTPTPTPAAPGGRTRPRSSLRRRRRPRA